MSELTSKELEAVKKAAAGLENEDACKRSMNELTQTANNMAETHALYFESIARLVVMVKAHVVKFGDFIFRWRPCGDPGSSILNAAIRIAEKSAETKQEVK